MDKGMTSVAFVYDNRIKGLRSPTLVIGWDNLSGNVKEKGGTTVYTICHL